MRNICMTIEYDGTRYSGWQIQDNAVTVQGTVESALSELCGEKISVTGSSRTDAGVHAENFVLNFHTSSTIPAGRFAIAVNSFLPGDIAAKSSKEVPDGFHARFDAREKRYRYLFYISPLPSAALFNRAWHVRLPDLKNVAPSRLEEKLELLNRAAAEFVGTHDFTTFRAEGSNVLSTVRTINDAKVFVIPENELSRSPLLCFEISGNGFLYNMVRIMAGTLMDVYKGKTSPEDIKNMLEHKSRKTAGMTAPPEGLYLCEVKY